VVRRDGSFSEPYDMDGKESKKRGYTLIGRLRKGGVYNDKRAKGESGNLERGEKQGNRENKSRERGLIWEKGANL